MKDNELKELIKDVKNSKEDAILIILDKYRKMININSYISGKFDEDLKQDLILKTIEAVKKFKI